MLYVEQSTEKSSTVSPPKPCRNARITVASQIQVFSSSHTFYFSSSHTFFMLTLLQRLSTNRTHTHNRLNAAERAGGLACVSIADLGNAHTHTHHE